MCKTVSVFFALLILCVLSLDSFGQDAKLPARTIKTVEIHAANVHRGAIKLSGLLA